VSGCNGCIEFTEPDNAGLNRSFGDCGLIYRNTVRDRSVFYGKFKFTLADVVALVSQRAVYLSSNYPELTMPTCNFRFGRKTCTGTQDNKEIFTSSKGNWTTTKAFFEKNFKYSTQEVVALLGAHTLGRTWSDNSGYTGPWVKFNNQYFDNTFYKNMINKDLKYSSVLTPGWHQWSSGLDRCEGKSRRECTPKRPGDTRIMLNSDMCFIKLFDTIDVAGTPNCTYDTCKTNDEASVFVEQYAASEPAFKKDFGAVFNRLVETQCEGLIDPEGTSAGPIVNFERYQNENTITKILQTAGSNSLKDQFKIYYFLFKKKYSLNSQEGINRYNIFKNNIKLIKDLNVKENAINYGFNKFTDSTNEEYYKYITGTIGDSIDFDQFADLEMEPNAHIALNAL